MLILGIPSFGNTTLKWSAAYKSLQCQLGYGYIEIHDESKSDIAVKRNGIIQAAIDRDAEVVFFLGDDVIPPPETLLMMLDHWRRGYKAVTGVYWTKGFPLQPYIFHDFMGGAFYDWKCGEFLKIAWAGCDCLMLDVKMLKEVGYPWFSLDYEFVKPVTNPDGRQGRKHESKTEDLYFYTKLKEHGVDVYCDTSIQCLHQDRKTGHLWGLTTNMPQYSGVPTAEKGLLIADVGCGDTINPLAQQNTVLRYDSNPEVRPDVRCDIRKIPEDDNVFDMVIASHILEHLPIKDAEKTLKEWLRILKPEGKLVVKVPDIRYACERIARGDLGFIDQTTGMPYYLLMLYGMQTSEGQFHKNGFVKEMLEALAKSISDNISVENTCPDDGGFTSELTLTILKTNPSEKMKIHEKWPMHQAGNQNPVIEGIENGHKQEKVKNIRKLAPAQ